MTTSLSEDSFKEERSSVSAPSFCSNLSTVIPSSMTPISAILSSSSCASSSSPSMPSIFCFKPLLSDFTEYTQTVTVGSASVTTMLSFSATPSTVSCCAAPAGAVPCSLVSPVFLAVGAHAPRTAAIIRPAAITINFFIMYLLVFSSQQLLHGFRNRFCLSHLFPSSADYIHSFYRCPSLLLNH